jgi:hypothetical protein
MYRECSHCHSPFSPQDLARDKSKEMEADRKAMGLRGIRFVRYTCRHCSYDDIFMDIHPFKNEGTEAFRNRRLELEGVLRDMHGDRLEVVLCER